MVLHRLCNSTTQNADVIPPQSRQINRMFLPFWEKLMVEQRPRRGSPRYALIVP